MSYTIAPTFEGNRMGVRRLRTLSGLRSGVGGVLQGLGDTQGDADAAVAAGLIDQGTANFLIAAGATDQDFLNLLTGATDVPTLMVRYTAAPTVPTIPGVTSLPAGASGGAGINPTVAPPPPPPAPTSVASTASGTQPSTAQVPGGSILTYAVTWSASPFGHPLTGASEAISGMQSKLPAYGMSVLSSTTNSLPLIGGVTGLSITLSVLDNVGHALLSDAKSVLDGVMQQIVGSNLSGSNVAIARTPTQPMPPGAAPADLTSWFEANWGYLAAALAAIVILPPLIKKI